MIQKKEKFLVISNLVLIAHRTLFFLCWLKKLRMLQKKAGVNACNQKRYRPVQAFNSRKVEGCCYTPTTTSPTTMSPTTTSPATTSSTTASPAITSPTTTSPATTSPTITSPTTTSPTTASPAITSPTTTSPTTTSSTTLGNLLWTPPSSGCYLISSVIGIAIPVIAVLKLAF